jgi:branched-chain amino acid transport system permease protein
MQDYTLSAVQGPAKIPSAKRFNIILGVGALLACVLPFAVSNYLLFQCTLIVANAIALLGLNLLTGYNGQISLGHGAFYAIGAYTTAILMDKLNVPYWLTIPLAGAVCYAAGYGFGKPALRLQGLYLALSTFALGVSLPQILRYKHFEEWTGGVQGVVLMKPSAPFGLPITDDHWLFMFTLVIMVGLFLAARNLLAGHTGQALIAIRDNPIAASAMGIDLARFKTVTFGVSAMYTGIAGALTALTVSFVAPDSFTVEVSILFLVGIVIGGLASIAGAVYGAIFIQLVPTVAEHVTKAATPAVFGLLLIASVYLLPFGLAGFIKKMTDRIGPTKMS